jgi:uncharacterized protein YycO
VKILLFRGRGIISALIRWQTRSRKYSHAAIEFSDGIVIEAWQGAGVRKTTRKPGPGIDEFVVCGGVSESQEQAIRTFSEAQVGKGYDYIGVLRFISRGRHDNRERWFCSELVFESLLAGGIRLLNVDGSMVHPEMLTFSPLIRRSPELSSDHSQT